MRALVWFREDLRIYDNKALFHASKNHHEIIGIYILDPAMWKSHDVAGCRVSFILEGLKLLQDNLEKYNIPFIFQKVSHTKKIPDKIFEIIKQFSADGIYYNRQYEYDESKRDLAVKQHLKKYDIPCYDFDDQTIMAPGSVKTQNGEYFKVFTPYKRAWIKNLEKSDPVQLLPLPKMQNKIALEIHKIPTKISGFNSTINSILWPAGEEIANQKLKHFIKYKISNYDHDRDYPAISGTSCLSPYLAAGMISSRQCMLAALNKQEECKANNQRIQGIETWISELIWREFYKHLLKAVLRISMSRPYKLITENLPWEFNQNHFDAWQEGMTGFPIIDAGMRQLRSTGWMHNRVRMIVAMFFSKNLLFDWRLGEKYFMLNLIDGDFAANNGGWQWCASTGTDAVPYFRIFNPILQSQRFDPKGAFIRQFCPELGLFDNKSIHHPHYYNPTLAKKVKYPEPIIDLQLSRKKAIEVYTKIFKHS